MGRIFKYVNTTASGETPPAETGVAARPNPFRTQTVLMLDLRRGDRFEMVLHDAAGRVVRHLGAGQGPGTPEFMWDGRDDDGRAVAAGVYYYRVNARESGTGRVVKLP
jgi:flagellar hook assembly protein FlgD